MPARPADRPTDRPSRTHVLENMSGHARPTETGNIFCFMTADGGAAAAAATAAAARTHVLENRSRHARPPDRWTDRPTLSNACASE